jgi:hypothetical protein
VQLYHVVVGIRDTYRYCRMKYVSLHILYLCYLHMCIVLELCIEYSRCRCRIMMYMCMFHAGDIIL